MPTVIFRNAVLDRMLNHPEGDVGRYLARKGRMIEAAARRQVGVRTGALRASIHMRHFRDSRGQYVKIGSPLNYALLHHEGSRPHMIYPDRSPVLRFARRGTIVFAHAVRHPGTKANRYLTDNLGLVR